MNFIRVIHRNIRHRIVSVVNHILTPPKSPLYRVDQEWHEILIFYILLSNYLSCWFPNPWTIPMFVLDQMELKRLQSIIFRFFELELVHIFKLPKT